MFLHVQKHKTQQKTIKKVHLSLMNRAMNANKSISNPLKTQQDWKWSVKTLLFNNGTKSENSTENWDFKNSSRKSYYFVSHFLILSYTVQTKRLAQLRTSSQIGQVRNTWSSSSMIRSGKGSSRRKHNEHSDPPIRWWRLRKNYQHEVLS